jgi:hypothetical protein
MVFLVLAVALIVRLLHLRYALNSPLTYQPGPDEDFYFRFGKAVAAGLGNDSTEFAFMDPFYGYMLGTVFKVAGTNLFVVYLLQVLLDTFTAYCIFQIGRLLDRPRAGLIAALLYGLACTAVLFTTTLLKATWVASYLVLWVLFGLVLLRTHRIYAWLLFGIWCGYGVALRGNLTLMVGLAVLLLGWLNVTWAKRTTPQTASRLALLLIGAALPLLLLATRNEQISKSFTPLPNNGGVVLHQVYNPDNPRGVNWVPKFVNYSHPTETWRGYAAEALRRTKSISTGAVRRSLISRRSPCTRSATSRASSPSSSRISRFRTTARCPRSACSRRCCVRCLRRSAGCSLSACRGWRFCCTGTAVRCS